MDETSRERQPTSFAVSVSREWERWCLAQGVPELPAEIRLGEAVPVSVWRDGDVGAVLFVRHVAEEDEEEPFVESDVVIMTLSDGRWMAQASGGGTWAPGTALMPAGATSEGVAQDGVVGYVDAERAIGCTIIHGVPVGSAIRVTGSGGSIVRPAVAPIGVQVVAAHVPFQIEVLDAAGIVVGPAEVTVEDLAFP